MTDFDYEMPWGRESRVWRTVAEIAGAVAVVLLIVAVVIR